jgi:hypothetical protein
VPTHQELVEKSEMVVSAPGADMAVALARAPKLFLKPGQMYVDPNDSCPVNKEGIDKIIENPEDFDRIQAGDELEIADTAGQFRRPEVKATHRTRTPSGRCSAASSYCKKYNFLFFPAAPKLNPLESNGWGGLRFFEAPAGYPVGGCAPEQ